jgi:hypothetical protein
VLPLFPITSSSAEKARRYSRVSHVFSWLNSIFVFDIVQIYSWCCPPSCTYLATGLRPRFPSIELCTVDTKFITAETSTCVLRKIHNAINSDIINTDGLEYLGRYCWKPCYGTVICLCVWMHLFTTYLEHNLLELLGNIPLVVCREIWGRYDGAPTHFGRDSPEYLNKFFPTLDLSWRPNCLAG